MDKDNSYLSLASIGGALMEQQVTNKILSCNQDTAVYGLSLIHIYPGQHLRRHLSRGNQRAATGLCGPVGAAVRSAEKALRIGGAVK